MGRRSRSQVSAHREVDDAKRRRAARWCFIFATGGLVCLSSILPHQTAFDFYQDDPLLLRAGQFFFLLAVIQFSLAWRPTNERISWSAVASLIVPIISFVILYYGVQSFGTGHSHRPLIDWIRRGFLT